jgi:hypothetical protein
MSSIPDLNFPLFNSEAARLRALGYKVVNPAEINPDINADWHACMRSDIVELVTCQAIAMLPGWAQSRGARLEHHIAEALGMLVLDADELVAELEMA